MTESELKGFADLHNHQFGNLAFGGRVVFGSPRGELDVLASCRPIHGLHGVADLVGSISAMLFDHRGPAALLGHGTSGSPDFGDWPRWNDYTHQMVHQTWLHRAVRGGLRLMVMLAVHNAELCRAKTAPWRKPADTVAAVRAQLDGARALERAIDAEAGGLGEGWYRIVDHPDEAARVISEGKLAVVLGAEVDDLFRLPRTSSATDDDLDAIVATCRDLGLHHIIPIHFVDNGVGGAAFQDLSWARDQRPFSAANPFGSVPLYRISTVDGTPDGYTYRGGRVNGAGLTPTGKRLIERLMCAGIVIDVEHMSARSRGDTFDIAEAIGRPVASGHATFRTLTRPLEIGERQLTDHELARIVGLKGMVAPMARQSGVDSVHLNGPGPSDTARGFLAAYRFSVTNGGEQGVGIGTDLNGFAGGTRPRFAASAVGEPRVTYPFATGFPGEPLPRDVSGTRVFDINQDGLAHVGLLPDLLAELRVLGSSPEELGPMMNSAAAYVDMWRAYLKS